MPPNALIDETSPYLLQHAGNPVHWQPWGPAAFDQARRENKPIFLSIGYSTCHWCHVMARESFENPAIAAELNAHFIPVKVDREERPDVDRIYMAYVQSLTGGGGWPMSVWLTPDLKPFHGGTYFPPEDRGGLPGFLSLLRQIAALWAQDPERIGALAANNLRQLHRAHRTAEESSASPLTAIPDQAFQLLESIYDPDHGGFGGAPKFPQPVILTFLFRYYARTGRVEARDMALHTLRKMAEGGLFDQLGGGFHRYSVDDAWFLPHFEKMLYDQAQLIGVYLDAAQIAPAPLWADIARRTWSYVRRELTGPEGQFYSAEDADSARPDRPAEHGEGAYYLWSTAELAEQLDPAQTELFLHYYGLLPAGNIRNDPRQEFDGLNLLSVRQSLDDTARHCALSADEIRNRLEDGRARLMARRQARPRPARDDKAITAWNGLMISAGARMAQVLDDPEGLQAAEQAAHFAQTRLVDPHTGNVWRCYRNGKASVAGFAEDYACLIQGLLDLYETGFDPRWLEWALALQQRQDALFWDAQHGGYFATTGEDPYLLLRLKDEQDGAEPSANSIAALNLWRLGHLTGRLELQNRAAQLVNGGLARCAEHPLALPQLLAAQIGMDAPPRHIVIAGRRDAPDTRALLREVHRRFLPHRILLLAEPDAGAGPADPDLIRGAKIRNGHATAYLCANRTCQAPVCDPAEWGRHLDEQRTPTSPPWSK